MAIFSGINIFIIDDQPANLQVLSAVLQNAGFQVFVARDARTGINKIKKVKPDLILLDILMPEIDGFEACRELKSHAETQEIPVIFMTALAESVDKVKGLKLGAVDYITKPFQHDEILARINNHLKVYHLTQQLKEQNRKLQEEIAKNRVQNSTIAGSINAIALADLQGRLTYVNSAFLKMWGYEQASEVVGRSADSFWQEPEAAQKVIIALMRDRTWSGELTGKKNNYQWLQEELFNVQVVANLITDTEDQPLCFMAAFLDITPYQKTETALQETEECLQRIIATVANGIIIVDKEGKVLFVNPAAEQLLGRSSQKLLNTIWGVPMVTGNSTEIALYRPDNTLAIVDMRVVELPWEENTAYLASLTDITARKQTEERLKILSQACEQSPASIVITNSEGDIEYVNPKFERVTGYKAEEVIGKNPRILKSGFTSEEEYQMLWDTITEGLEWHGEFQNKRKDGQLFWEKASISPIRDENDVITHFVAVKEDITAQKETAAILFHQAKYDALTDLPNRFLAHDRMHQAIAQAERKNKRVAVMFVDLDHFKNINDTLGHAMGDHLLMLAAQRLLDALRSGDTVARLGGDEFLIILPDIEQPFACKAIAQKILDILNQPFDLGGEEVCLSGSIGIAIYPDDALDIGGLMSHADAAMYCAKQAGRNLFKFFTNSMNEAAQRRIRLENHLRHALANQEISVYYQPFIHLASGVVVGAEALMRWNSPELGMVRPDHFIPVAEESGLINPLGEWITSQACQAAMTWREITGYELWVAVNMSPRQFRDHGLVDAITNALSDSGLPGHCLELEITERLLMEDVPGANEMIQDLTRLELRLSIDDFGTGYSSLSYLKRFPFTVLKIDKSFITDIPHDPEAVSLVKTIIAMAHGLHLRVIAEGVETLQQLEFLYQEGCDYAQGYWFSPPLAADRFQWYLTQQMGQQTDPLKTLQSHNLEHLMTISPSIQVRHRE